MIQTEVEIINGGELSISRRGYLTEKDVRRVNVKSRFVQGNFRLAINESLRKLLGLEIIGKRHLTDHRGNDVFAEFAEFVELRLANRRTIVEPFILPNETYPLLGSFILQDLDVIIDEESQSLIVPPERPFFAQTYLKKNRIQTVKAKNL